MPMNKHFEIVGGIVYLDKSLYTNSLKVDNDLSKLVGSTCANIFKTRPRIQCGVESVTIDYAGSDSVSIDQDPVDYIRHLQEQYHSRVRGHLVLDIGEDKPVDMLINTY